MRVDWTRRALVALGAVGLLGAAPLPDTVEAREAPEDHGVGAVQIPAEIPVRRDHGAEEARPRALQALAMATGLGAALFVALYVGKRRQRMAATSGGPSRWAPWLGRGTASAPLRRLQTLRLTTRSSLHLVQWNDRELLLGSTETGMSVLGERPVSPAAEPETAAGAAGAKP